MKESPHTKNPFFIEPKAARRYGISLQTSRDHEKRFQRGRLLGETDSITEFFEYDTFG
jgi:hypothetical protein